MTKKHGGALIDLGNTVIAHWLSKITPENFDTIDYNSIPWVPEVFESLRWLNEIFGGNVTIVYKASDTATEKIIGWLNHHRFTERTGIPMERVRRSMSRDKTSFLDHSSETFYGTTVVIDDRLEVLSYFVGKVKWLFLFRPQKQEVEAFKHTGALDYIHIVQTWKRIRVILLAHSP